MRWKAGFENYRYKEDLFPTSRFRMAYDALAESQPGQAVKEYLKILKLTAEEGEVPVDEALRVAGAENRDGDHGGVDRGSAAAAGHDHAGDGAE